MLLCQRVSGPEELGRKGKAATSPAFGVGFWSVIGCNEISIGGTADPLGGTIVI